MYCLILRYYCFFIMFRQIPGIFCVKNLCSAIRRRKKKESSEEGRELNWVKVGGPSTDLPFHLFIFHF